MTSGTEPTAGRPARHLEPVFVLARTRSGTTLLQRLLNTSPELTVWGETAGILEPLVQTWLVADAFKNNFTAEWKLIDELVGPLADPERFGPWVSPVTDQRVWEQVREAILALYTSAVPADVVWGCKEVRVPGWVGEGLLQLFPRARIIVMVRNPRDWLSSHVRVPWQKDYQPSDFAGTVSAATQAALVSSLDEWTDLYDSFWPLISAGHGGVRVLSYDTLQAEPVVTAAALQRWLGVTEGAPDLLGQVAAARAGTADVAEWTDAERAQLAESVDAVVAASRAPKMFADWCAFEAAQSPL